MSENIKSLWIVTREFAHIAEAGGVKNVACSLAVNLQKKGTDITVFIPQYKCTDLKCIKDYKKTNLSCKVTSDGVEYNVTFAQGYFDKVKVIFVQNKIFAEKNAVYVYTKADKSLNPSFEPGTGHHDSFQMNAIFQQAVLHYGFLTEQEPQIIHCQDAATSLTAVFARNHFPFVRFYADTKFVVTIHNAGPGYLQTFPSIDFAKRITGLPENVLKHGIPYYNTQVTEPFLLSSVYAHLTTVSPWYAKELYDSSNQFCLLARDFIENGILIEGITNGIDYENYDPSKKEVSLLSHTFNPLEGDFAGKLAQRKDFFAMINATKDFIKTEKEKLPCFGKVSDIDDETVIFVYQGRLVSQKGIEIFSDAANRMLEEKRNVCFIVHGQGQAYLENHQTELAFKYPGRYCYIQGYDRTIARNVVSCADFLVLPSIFEPCCLEDFIAQIYGTIPIANAVGGLNKIQNNKTGFLYTNNTSQNLHIALLKAMDIMQTEKEKINQMRIDAATTVKNIYSWSTIIDEKYIPFYRSIT